MRAMRTPLVRQRDCQLEEAVADQEDMGAPASFDSRERPKMQQLKTRGQEYQLSTPVIWLA